MSTTARAILLSGLLIAGCAGTGGKSVQPDWVYGRSAMYPDAQYLIGRGSAATPAEAADRARADLAKVFEVNIAAESADVQAFMSSGGQSTYESKTQRSVSTRTEQLVRGIQMADRWQDPQTTTNHALAMLPRLQTANSLREDIGRLDSATRTHMERALSSEDLFLKIAAAARALELQVERQGYQKMLKVVDVTGRGVESEWNTGQLAADLNVLLKRVKVAVRVAEGSPARFGDIVNGAVAAAGFLADTGPNPDFVLSVRLDTQDLGMQEGWYWQRGTLDFSLAEGASNRVRGTKTWPIKTSARDQASAASRTLDDAEKLLRAELRSTLVGIATAVK